MKYFLDCKILYEKFFIITKYCPILDRNINIVVTDMNNVKSNSDLDIFLSPDHVECHFLRNVGRWNESNFLNLIIQIFLLILII